MPSERLFSTAGATISKLRSSLDSSTADQLLFINKNMRHHPEFVEMTKDTPTAAEVDELYIAPVPLEESDRTGPQSTRPPLPIPEPDMDLSQGSSTSTSLFSSQSSRSSLSQSQSSQPSASQGGPTLPTLGVYKSE